jgi:opacity protein-like surface antigen
MANLLTRNPIGALAALCALLLAAPALHAGEVDMKSLKKEKKKYGPYVGVFGGATTGHDGDTVLGAFDYDLADADGSAVFGIEVGYSWRTRYLLEFAVEFEGLFSSSQLDTTFGSGNTGSPAMGDVATASADLNYAAFMLNGVVNLDLRRLQPRIGRFVTRFRPYFGLGIGGAQVWYRNQSVATFGDLAGIPTAPTSSPFLIDEFVLATQLFGGLEVRVNDKVGFYAEYRQLMLSKLDELTDYSTEMWLGGIRVRY